jgi:hypothetical protein
MVPGRSGYDPTKFKGFVPVPRIFDQEPRDPAWANRVEEGLRVLIQADMKRAMPSLRLTGATCKTTMCAVEWSGGESDRRILRETAMIFMPGSLGAVIHGSDSDTFYFALAGGRHYGDVAAGDAAAALVRLGERREKLIGQLKRGSQKGSLPLAPRIPLPANIWPDR